MLTIFVVLGFLSTPDSFEFCTPKGFGKICLECFADPDAYVCPPAACDLTSYDFRGTPRESYEVIAAPCHPQRESTTGGACIGTFCAGCISFNYESTGPGAKCWVGGCHVQCSQKLGCETTGCLTLPPEGV